MADRDVRGHGGGSVGQHASKHASWSPVYGLAGSSATARGESTHHASSEWGSRRRCLDDAHSVSGWHRRCMPVSTLTCTDRTGGAWSRRRAFAARAVGVRRWANMRSRARRGVLDQDQDGATDARVSQGDSFTAVSDTEPGAPRTALRRLAPRRGRSHRALTTATTLTCDGGGGRRRCGRWRRGRLGPCPTWLGHGRAQRAAAETGGSVRGTTPDTNPTVDRAAAVRGPRRRGRGRRRPCPSPSAPRIRELVSGSLAAHVAVHVTNNVAPSARRRSSSVP